MWYVEPNDALLIAVCTGDSQEGSPAMVADSVVKDGRNQSLGGLLRSLFSSDFHGSGRSSQGRVRQG